MRIGNYDGRLVLAAGTAVIDVEEASGHRFDADPAAIYTRWEEFTAWAGSTGLPPGRPFVRELLGPPSPAPSQIFAIGLNYHAHVAETHRTAPEGFPVVFTKFASSLTGPVSTVELPADGHTDWELELVVVIGRAGSHIPEEAAWQHVAGLTAGQDLSERILQRMGPVPQFSLGKSYPGFAPTGPWLVTPDEFADPDDIELRCWLDGEQVQADTTANMIFSVPRLIHLLSGVTPLRPGDLVFSGTPSGVGLGREPQRFIAPGEVLVSRIAGVGELEQRFVASQR
jgi:2-keto-4-pentenoate hydratase/2-oxohepta-3-ene-1,7-dioic acid hydratase in catechol pathway